MANNELIIDPACDGNASDEKTRRKKGYIPYGSVYESQDDVRKRGYWIPRIPISSNIVKVEKNTSSHYHILNPFLYTIELQHSKYKWKVIKNYQDFSYLRNRLITHRAVEKIKSPMRRARDRLEDVIEGSDEEKEMFQDVANAEKNINILSKSGEFDEVNGNDVNLFAEEYNEVREGSELSLPHFPMIPDLMISETHLTERKEKLEAWLQTLLNISIYRNYHETAEFLQTSRFSFVNELGGKYREGNVKKRPGGNKVYIGCRQFCVRWLLPWGKRWLIVKDTYVCYMNPSNEKIRMVLLFDEQFEINSADLAINFRPKDLYLSNLQHVLAMKCDQEGNTLQWINTIKNVLKDTGQVWLKKKPFGSSFPPRINGYCQWFVDAKDYWEKAAAMIEMAREEIFIADWWLCPEVYMRRPMAEGNHWRLDYVLKRQAEKGVHIFVLIYKEMEMALGLNSLYSKKHLQNLHPNIKVMRHPDHYVGTGTFFWAHHEKLLIIDQLIAFIGGVDLCYGRWDDSRHVLTDLGSAQIVVQSISDEKKSDIEEISKLGESIDCKVSNENEENLLVHKVVEDITDEQNLKIGEKTTTTVKPIKKKLNGLEQNTSTSRPKLKNAMNRVMARIGHQSYEQTLALNQSTDPKHYFDEINIQNSLSKDGKPMFKFYNMTTLGDIVDSDGTMSKSAPISMEPKNRTLLRRVVTNLRPSKVRRHWRTPMDLEDTAEEYVIKFCQMQETKVDMSGLQGAGKLWPGKDYVNYLKKDFVNVHEAFSDFINRYETPRTPWHDIHSVVYGEAARDIARHFIQRWNATKTEKLKNNDNYPYLLPKSYHLIRIPKVFINSNTHSVEIQVLRSVSHWSTLIDKNEDSIQQAYLSLIANAKHYIYIENQFFVSMINNSDVSNEICKVLCERITRAHKNNETFRVFILIPLLPGFEGDIGNTYSALLAVLHWTMISISNGQYSLLENLKLNGVEDPGKYLTFCSLRTYDELGTKLVTEMVYIHSKLMIVDDLYTIIGSANINDRSQAGNRDSEVCVLITDREFISSKMNGQPYKAGKFAFSLRKRVMEEHLGLLEDSLHKNHPSSNISVSDPISDEFFLNIWCKATVNNAQIFEDTFRCYPTNSVKTFQELLSWRSKTPLALSDPKQARINLKKLTGNLVIFPTKFLNCENLTPTITSKEGLVPSVVFT